MDRRDFFKTAAGAVVALPAVVQAENPFTAPAEAARAATNARLRDEMPTVKQMEINAKVQTPKPDGVTSIRYPEATLSVGLIAEYVIERVAELLPYPCALAEPHAARMGEGLKIGHIVVSDAPGLTETWAGKRPVTMTDQLHAIMASPFHFNGDRRPDYSVYSDREEDVPVMVAEPVVLAQLTPVIELLRSGIVRHGMNVFTAQMFLPAMGETQGPSCEGAVIIVSQKLGLALRVIRMCSRESLMMRFDLMGGRYPSETASVT